MKKLIVFSLVALMAISSVFAGGSKEAASDNGVKTLTFAVWDYTQNAYLSKAIAAFEAANPDIKIEVQDSPRKYIEIVKLVVMFRFYSECCVK